MTWATMFACAGAHYLNDLSQYDPSSSVWTDLSSAFAGSPPTPRDRHTLVSLNEKLWTFGGQDSSGDANLCRILEIKLFLIAFCCLLSSGVYLNDLYGVSAPKEILWGSNSQLQRLNQTFQLAAFLNVYDWDTLVLPDTSVFVLSAPLILCTNLLPCALTIKGLGQPVILRTSNGSILCMASNGCRALNLVSISFRCGVALAQHSVLEFSGNTSLSVSNASFTGCCAVSSGGAMQLSAGSIGMVSASRFTECHSSGQGGAISAVSSTLSLASSYIANSSSALGGGCVHSSGNGGSLSVSDSIFWACSSLSDGGGIQTYGGVVARIDSSMFRFDASLGSGGAISAVGSRLMVGNCSFRDCFAANKGGGLFSSGLFCYNDKNMSTNLVEVRSSSFCDCRAEHAGGAAAFVTSSVIARVINTSFANCSSDLGGAIAVTETAEISLSKAVFSSCAASLGGGALYGSQALIMVNASSYSSCASSLGGGAVLLTNTSFMDDGSVYTGNSAVGGGGAILWDGSPPVMITSPDDTRCVEVENSSKFGICCNDNKAAYGDCIASTFSHLEVNGLPSDDAPAHPGLPFTVVVVKKDSYNQTIASDSLSIIDTFVSQAQSRFTTPVISDISISRMKHGEGKIVMIIRPGVSETDSSENLVVFASDSIAYFKGLDAESIRSNIVMQSHTLHISFSNRSNVCPTGYILQVDGFGWASCTYCGSGTYSLNPLKGRFAGQLPACLNCPPYSVCSGGSNVVLPVGTWEQFDGMFRLIDCPNGTALIGANGGNSECVQCIPGQYILDPKLPPCVHCPLGGACINGIFHSVVPGSLWERNGSYMRIKSCPAGYILIRSGTRQVVSLSNPCQLLSSQICSCNFPDCVLKNFL